MVISRKKKKSAELLPNTWILIIFSIAYMIDFGLYITAFLLDYYPYLSLSFLFTQFHQCLLIRLSKHTRGYSFSFKTARINTPAFVRRLHVFSRTTFTDPLHYRQNISVRSLECPLLPSSTLSGTSNLCPVASRDSSIPSQTLAIAFTWFVCTSEFIEGMLILW